MKYSWKERWLEALRSKKYRQGNGHLKNTVSKKNTFCCLGVLCDVAGVRWTEGDCVFGNRDGMLSDEGMKFFGLTDSQTIKLADMNDNEEKSFAEIADYIEKKL